MRATKKLIAVVAVLLVCLLSFGFWSWNTQWIDAGEVGIIFNMNGGIQTDAAGNPLVYSPRGIFLWPTQQLYRIPTKLEIAIYSQDSSWGEEKSTDGILVTTSEGANTVFDVAVMYRIEPQNVGLALKTFGPIPIDQIQTQHIRRAVKDGVNGIGNKYDVYGLLGVSREQASADLTNELRTRLGPKGVTVIQAMFLNGYPDPNTSQKIANTVNSATQVAIASIDNQIAEMQKEAAVVTAQAQQQARVMAASQTADKSIEMLDLELQEEAVDRWNGHLSPIRPGSNKTVIVGGNGQIIPTGGR